MRTMSTIDYHDRIAELEATVRELAARLGMIEAAAEIRHRASVAVLSYRLTALETAAERARKSYSFLQD